MNNQAQFSGEYKTHTNPINLFSEQTFKIPFFRLPFLWQIFHGYKFPLLSFKFQQ